MSLFNRFYVYRRLNSGSYKRIGQVELGYNSTTINYNTLPFKLKYYPFIGLTSNDCGEVREQHLKADKWSK